MPDPDGSNSPRRPGRRSSVSPNVAAALVLVTIAAAIVLWRHPWSSASPDRAESADAARILPDQLDALSRATTRAEFERAAGQGSAARSWARQVWAARQALDVDDVRFSYASGGTAADRSDGSAGAVVDVSWSPGPSSVLGSRTVRPTSATLRVRPTASGRLDVVGATAVEGSVLPVWLAGEVSVEREGTDAALVTIGDDPVDRPLAMMVRRASEAVRRIVPPAEGRLVVLAPDSRSTTAALLGRREDQVDAVAAVTTTLDSTSKADRIVVLNPRLFASMDVRAGQVVMTHEATHLLTGVVGDDLPAWIVEGFADYVALHDDDAPLTVSAGQILKQVGQGDVPERLPRQSDFGNSTHGLGAVYESAWLAFRMLGERYGTDRVVDFYDAVDDGTSVASALQTSFGLTEDQLTQQWRDYLTKMASTVS